MTGRFCSVPSGFTVTRTAVRSKAAASPDHLKEGATLLRVSPGVYRRNPNQFLEDADVSDASLAVELDEVELEEGASGCVYAFSYPGYASLGWLKIGRAENLEVRMKQHQAAAKNAAMPGCLFLSQAGIRLTLSPLKEPPMAS